MRHKKLKLGILFLLVLGLMDLQGQEEIISSFGNFNGQGGSINYTAGQLVYNTFTGVNGSVGQGVQQPIEISVITSIESGNSIKLSCVAFPNPTFNDLKLIIESDVVKEVTYQVFDVSGKRLDFNSLSSNNTIIPMSEYTSGIYFLKVNNDNEELITFKIIKR
jgi:hypothetical protein